MYVNLVGTDSPDYHLEGHKEVIFSSKKWWNRQRSAKCTCHSRWHLIWGYIADGRDHNRTLRPLMQICHQENLKLIKISVISYLVYSWYYILNWIFLHFGCLNIDAFLSTYKHVIFKAFICVHCNVISLECNNIDVI